MGFDTVESSVTRPPHKTVLIDRADMETLLCVFNQ